MSALPPVHRRRVWSLLALILVTMLVLGGSPYGLAAPLSQGAAPSQAAHRAIGPGIPLAPGAEAYRFAGMWQPEFGDFPTWDSIFFLLPHDVAIGPDGYVHVADSGNNRIQKFTPDGEFIAKWGCCGSE